MESWQLSAASNKSPEVIAAAVRLSSLPLLYAVAAAPSRTRAAISSAA